MDEEEDEVQYKGGEEMIEEEEQGGGGANHLGADLHLTKLQPASQQVNWGRPDNRKRVKHGENVVPSKLKKI